VAMVKSKSLFRDQRGNVLLLTAFGLPLLLGSIGLAVDATEWVVGKHQLQQRADAAAMAGVYGLLQGGDAESAVDRSLTLGPALSSQASTLVTQSPAGREQDPFAVSVRLTSPATMTFSSLFLRPFTMSAEAVATVVEDGEYCAFAMGSGDQVGLELRPNSSLTMECGIATNSSSKFGIKADGTSSIKAPRIVSSGGIHAEDAIRLSGVKSYGVKQKDPLVDTDPPEVPNTGCPNVTVNPDSGSSRQGQVVLKPGCYGNMVLNGNVTLEPGEYILNRGNLVVGPAGNVTCEGCTIFLTSRDAAEDPGSVGKVSMDQRATVKLTAPEDGSNAGILIYQDRRASSDIDGQENSVGGGSFSQLQGLLYFPSDTVRLDGRMAPDVRCARVIGKRLIIEGRIFIAKDCAGMNKVNFAGTEVRLVE
jgi:Flp pilus assembly protein TadG